MKLIKVLLIIVFTSLNTSYTYYEEVDTIDHSSPVVATNQLLSITNVEQIISTGEHRLRFNSLEELNKTSTTRTTNIIIVEIEKDIQQQLIGRPLYNYSKTIAEACYQTGMDPYWFCTIAITESGAGANCFRSYNAWGYGQYSWNSWEESILSFCQMFTSNYGSGLSSSTHLTYCPSGAYSKYI